MQGLLTGKWLTYEEIPDFRSRGRHFDSSKNEKSRHGESGHEELLFKTIKNLNEVAKKANMPLVDLANAWPLHTPGVTCVITGATKASQVRSNAKAV